MVRGIAQSAKNIADICNHESDSYRCGSNIYTEFDSSLQYILLNHQPDPIHVLLCRSHYDAQHRLASFALKRGGLRPSTSRFLDILTNGFRLRLPFFEHSQTVDGVLERSTVDLEQSEQLLLILPRVI